MSCALRVSVPLNSMCSRKCAAPCSSAGSSRAPVSTHSPIDTDRTCGIDSVTSRSPRRGSERSNEVDDGLLVVGPSVAGGAVRTYGRHLDGLEVELAVRTDLRDPH